MEVDTGGPVEEIKVPVDEVRVLLPVRELPVGPVEVPDE